MLHNLKKFALDESGAVTVDWVVLTALVVGLGIAVVGVIKRPMTEQTESVSTFLQSTPIIGTF